jgi:hypothetical protein
MTDTQIAKDRTAFLRGVRAVRQCREVDHRRGQPRARRGAARQAWKRLDEGVPCRGGTGAGFSTLLKLTFCGAGGPAKIKER